MFVTDEEIYEAYLDCRKHKQSKLSAMEFEWNLEENLCNLADDLNSHRYKISASMAFCVTRPKLREVFAADFRDRIVHHFIMMRLGEILESEMIDESYNCRKGKGTAYAVKDISKQICQISENYTRECYILKCDIKGFFMHIDKRLLWRRLEDLIDRKYERDDKDEIKWLVKLIVMNRPEINCVKVGDLSLFEKLDPDKSKFKIDAMKGVEIGNIPSQKFANFFLSPFDHYMKTAVMGYGIYVDDFCAIDVDKKKLLALIPKIRKMLKDEYGLELHPRKISLQSYTKGLKFVGSVMKYERIMTGNRTVGNLYNLVESMKDCKDKEGECEKYAARLNSYFGFMKYGESHAILVKVNKAIQKDWSQYLYMGRNHTIKVKDKYKTKNIIINQIKQERYGNESNRKKRRVRRVHSKRKRSNRDLCSRTADRGVLPCQPTVSQTEQENVIR